MKTPDEPTAWTRADTPAQTVLRLDARLDGPAVPALREVVEATDPTRDLVVDLSTVTHMNPQALRVLLHADRTRREHGRSVRLRSPCEAVEGVLVATGADRALAVEERPFAKRA